LVFDTALLSPAAVPATSPHQSTFLDFARPTNSFQRTGGNTMAHLNGTIKRLVSDKGFGFILATDGNEYFFHNSACSDARFDDLHEGQAVSFDCGQGPKGPRGENVRTTS
jgi:CspA family cold shock protein